MANTKETIVTHHWTFNHSENGEKIKMSQGKHSTLHGIVLALSDEMSIRREIIYELEKVIPPEEMLDTLEEIIVVIKGRKMLRGMRK